MPSGSLSPLSVTPDRCRTLLLALASQCAVCERVPAGEVSVKYHVVLHRVSHCCNCGTVV